MIINNYILDFERLNELTSNKNDNPTEGYTGTFFYGISKKILKKYLDVFIGELKVSEDETKHIIDTLVYNRILIHKSIIRENRIDEILDEQV
jgi:hypothetical protein